MEKALVPLSLIAFSTSRHPCCIAFEANMLPFSALLSLLDSRLSLGLSLGLSLSLSLSFFLPLSLSPLSRSPPCANPSSSPASHPVTLLFASSHSPADTQCCQCVTRTYLLVLPVSSRPC
eukprot:2371540-Pleurochrysis_carterae.AAC.1